MSRKVVAIVGLEVIKNKKGEVDHFSDTFLNNIHTFHRDNPNDTLKVFDMRDYKGKVSPMGSLWSDIAAAFDGIDLILYSGHSDTETLYVCSKVRTELFDSDRFIDCSTDWSSLKFADGANIQLMGCQTGGQDGRKFPECIAQDIANKTDVAVWGFASKSSQQIRNGGYYQVPDTGDYIKFTSILEKS